MFLFNICIDYTLATSDDDVNQFIGKTYWVAERFREFISGKSVSQPSLSFIVEEVSDSEKGKILKVKFSTGEIGYIYLSTFLSSLNTETSLSPPGCHFSLRAFTVFVIDPAQAENDCKQKEVEREEREAEARELRREAEATIIKRKEQEVEIFLSKLGISRDKHLWLKYPITTFQNSKLPGLTKVKITDLKFFTGEYETLITIYIKVDTQEAEITFNYYTNMKDIIPKVKEAFYIKDPSSIIIAKWGKKVLRVIKEGEIFLGMTTEQVRLSWGLPKDINRSIGAWGIHEQWVYGDYTYLYFENGILTSFQD